MSNYILGNGGSTGFRYPYPVEPPPPVDRPNPFVKDSELSQEANSVVQAFMQGNSNMYANTTVNYNGNNKRYADSLASDALSPGFEHHQRLHQPPAHHQPGRIEDLDSPTSPYNQLMSPSSTTDASVDENNVYGNLDVVRMQQQQEQQQHVTRGISSTRSVHRFLCVSPSLCMGQVTSRMACFLD